MSSGSSIHIDWPWGRIPPSRRLCEIDRIIERNLRQKRILQEQSIEAARRIDLNLSALQRQRQIVQEFIPEEERRSSIDKSQSDEVLGLRVLGILETSSTEQLAEVIDGLVDPELERKEAESHPGSPDSSRIEIEPISGVDISQLI